MRAKNGEPAKFIDEVAVSYVGNDCLIWPFARQANGYGFIMKYAGRKWIVSRLICTLVYGEPPTPQHEAAHSCGKGHEGCCNPTHLSWKTPSQNRLDKLLHGTDNRGEKHNMAKLTAEQVAEIRDLHKVVPQRVLAEMYGVGVKCIEKIHYGDRWAWF